MTAKRKLKKLQQAKTLVTDVVSDKAAVLNPLTPRPPEQPAINEDVPNITNKTLAEHREDVLSGARKYIYPLAHSKRRIVVVTSGIIAATIVAFLVYCFFGLYNLYQYNSFLYRVTQVVPFPIAKEDGHYIDYENYLFELRHYVHYYQSQLQSNFAGADKAQLLQFRKQALTDTINAAYVKQLAAENGVTVSDQEVNSRINEVRDQNRLGSDNKVFTDVLHDYWGWSLTDFKRSLKQEILAEKVAAKLDTAANQKAQLVLSKLKAGANFGKLAKKYSDDAATRSNSGQYATAITKSDPNVPPQVIDALFSLRPGKISGIIVASPVLSNNGPTLEIVKVLKTSSQAVVAQHISIKLTNISVYVKRLSDQHPAKLYVHF